MTAAFFNISEHFFELRFPMEGPFPETPGQTEAESGAESKVEWGAESLPQRILVLLKAAPLAKSELALALGFTNVSGALNRAVTQLMQHALIERTLPDKPQSRLQKYRLTRVAQKRFETGETISRNRPNTERQML